MKWMVIKGNTIFSEHVNTSADFITIIVVIIIIKINWIELLFYSHSSLFHRFFSWYFSRWTNGEPATQALSFTF
jgi:hypothetical protein